jgi:hypothetical protein
MIKKHLSNRIVSVLPPPPPPPPLPLARAEVEVEVRIAVLTSAKAIKLLNLCFIRSQRWVKFEHPTNE